MKKDTLLKIGSAAMLIGVIVVNALANILPINNKTTGMVSKIYPNLFTPAGITFAIWTVIYLALAVFVIKQFFDKRQFLNKINTLFIISSVFNIAWIFAWHYLYVIPSVIMMLGLLICLIMIAKTITDNKLSDIKDAWIKIPFGVYFGWITIATIANITAMLVNYQWNGFGLEPFYWMVIISIVGAIIGLFNSYRYNNIYYLLAIIWAFTGILIRHISPAPAGFANSFQSVVITVAAILAILVGNLGYKLYLLFKKG